MMQGDSYKLPVQISTPSGTADGSSFQDIEVMIGPIRKSMKEREVTYDSGTLSFMVHLTQSETFRLTGMQKVQIRVKMHNGDVFGVDAGDVDVAKSVSKAVL